MCLDEGRETVWLTQRQMGEVFETTPENVLMHLKNIFNDEELAEKATTKGFLLVRQEGRRAVRRKVQHYYLDAIISVIYRVNSRYAVRIH
ncbi:RhuM family protein [Salinicola sp. V024]|uniref:RhuM family protein n=1 Tax=Salinicola sp. V024 TaxID=3459609 RepID=UPI004043BC48